MPLEAPQKTSDDWSRMMSGLGLEVFTSQDIFVTMRFSDLTIEEMFPATMSFGNSRMFLYTGIAQCQRMAEALTKYQAAQYKVEGMSEQDRRLLPAENVKYEPREVDDFLKKWAKYKPEKEPYDAENLPVILNELAPYNQSLQWWSMAWEPIQRAHYNLLYAVNSRTFKGFVDLGKNMYEREHEVAVGQRRRWPWSGKKKDGEE